jgi:DNA polymerase III subunit delta
MAKAAVTPNSILSDINDGIIRPVYFLMGEEPWYIDNITNVLLDKLLNDSEKDFDLSIVYGKDVSMNEVIMLARQYPMIALKKVVLVKEAQDTDGFDNLLHYLEKPMLSTVLIFNYKNGSLDKRKKLFSELEKTAVVYESKKIYDEEIPGWIEGYVSSKGISIDHKSSCLIADFIGSDLSRIIGEIDKLMITIPSDEKKITSDHIERNIGISKEYNDFELLNAVIRKEVFKANKIAVYFSKNPKNYPLVKTIATFANFFINLMLYHYLADKNPQNVVSELGVNFYRVKDFEIASKNYNGVKTMQIVRLLRTFDAKSKGFDSRSIPDYENLRELLYKILH